MLARARWRAIASGELVDDSGEVMKTSGPFTGSLHYARLEGDPRVSDPAYEEEGFRRMCENRYRTELSAYNKLRNYQGTLIPKCFGAIYGLILEYIDGLTLHSLVDEAEQNGLQHPLAYVPHSLLEIAHAMGSHGGIHGDIRLGNILVTPTRAVLIDFGHAMVRPEGIPDATWDEEVEKEVDLGAVRQFLHRHRIRDMSPYLPEEVSWDGRIARFNEVIGHEQEQWRLRWYNHVAPELDSEDRSNPARETVVQQWVMKPHVKVWRNTRPPPPERWRVPRPGSPGFSLTESVDS